MIYSLEPETFTALDNTILRYEEYFSVGPLMKVSEGYEHEKTIVHNVVFGNEKFEYVKNISKFSNCSNKNCKYFKDCCNRKGGVVRTFDCKKNARKVLLIYFFLTSTIITWVLITIFKTLQLSFVKGTAALIISLVILDIICSIIENLVLVVRDKLFYNKLKKIEKINRKNEKIKKQEEEAKKAAEELEKTTKNPHYKSVIEAEVFVNSLKVLSDKYNFGVNNDKIDECVKKLMEIIELLKKDSTGYNRVAYLFEAYLPEFYNTLNLYSNFIKADIKTEEYEETLTICVDKFNKFLNNQKIEAIFDKSSIEIQFKVSAETLGNMIDKGE